MDKYTKGFLVGAGVVTGTFIAAILIFMFFFNDGNRNAASLDNSEAESLNAYQQKEEWAIKYIKKYFYKDVDLETLYEGALDGIVESLDDPYASYYSPSEMTQIMKTNDGEYVGIGCTVAQMKDTQEIVVLSIVEDSPAEKAGLRAEDVIIAVDGTDITQMDLDYAMTFVAGEKGTSVTLTVKRGDEKFDLTMVRDKIKQKVIYYEMLDDEIGYIYLSAFHKPATEQTKKALEDLKSQGMKKLVFDLRQNPGGLFDTAVEMIDLMIPKDCLAVYIEDKEGKKSEYYTKDADEIDIPMVVLIDGMSASAAELFTQAMRDYKKATIVGVTSYGKGVYQDFYPLGNDGSYIKMTGGRYFSPSGVCVDGVGIVPDIVVELDESIYEKEEVTDEDDNQLQAAIDFLKNN